MAIRFGAADMHRFGQKSKHANRLTTSSGFTLIELLVAVGIMALMAGLSWRSLDGMSRAQAQLKQRTDSVLALQAGLAQWSADLDAINQLPQTPALDWDGRGLRILRHSLDTGTAELVVVAWASRTINGHMQWLRWQSPPVRSRGDLQASWAQAAQWAQNPRDADKKYEVRVSELARWQIFYYRRDAWTNPFSSGGIAPQAGNINPAVADNNLPDGVRLVLSLPVGEGISGTLTRDWIRPTLGGGKS
jgi:general secretion pathway protein J